MNLSLVPPLRRPDGPSWAVLPLLSMTGALWAADPLETMDEALQWTSPAGDVAIELNGLLDLEVHYLDQTPPGLLFGTDDFLVSPRFSAFLEGRIGKRWSALAQLRADRGFDPGASPDGAVRLDEYWLRCRLFDAGQLNLQFGKSATLFGNWVQRHDSWHNPFINAPVAYEAVTTVGDLSAPASVDAFLARRDLPDRKDAWLPIVWGPSYATGASVFGQTKSWDYGVEIKNASLSSRPSVWDATQLSWEYPTVTARLGHRPNADWAVGTSWSHGAYLLPEAESSMPPDTTLGDFMQSTVGVDVRFARRHWEIWAEAMATRFEVPRAGEVEVLSYYIEARRKITPNLAAAVRWNQQFHDEIASAGGTSVRWDHDLWRAEVAATYRWTRYVQTKLQYGYTHLQGPIQQGEQYAGVQLTLRF